MKHDLAQLEAVAGGTPGLSDAILSATRDPLMCFGDHGIAAANTAFAELLGYATPEELLGRAPRDLTVPLAGGDPPAFSERHLALAWEDRWHRCECVLVRQDTSRVPVEVTLTAVPGRRRLFHAALRDLSEQRAASARLRLEEARLDALVKLNSMADASMKEIVDFGLEEAVRLTGSEIGYIAAVNEDESVLTMISWSRMAMHWCQIEDKPIVYPMAKTGLWGEAVRQRQPVITNDYAADNPHKHGYPKGHVPILRHMNVPVFDGSKIVIVAGVGNKGEDYNANDVRQLGLLMEGVWKHIQRQRANAELSVYRDHLERLVAERTAELAESNRHLDAANQTLEREITERLHTEELLQNWLHTERLVRETSTRFANLSSEEISPAILDLLKRIAGQIRADMVAAQVLHDDGFHTNTLYRWQVGEPAGAVGVFPAGFDEQVADDRLDVSQFASTVQVPIMVAGRMRGTVTLGTYSAAPTWSQEDVAVVSMLGEIVVGGVLRLEAAEAVRCQRDRAEDSARHLATHINQLNCLQAISRLLEEPDRTLGEIVQKAVRIIPSAWKHGAVVGARAVLRDEVFANEDFRESEYCCQSSIRIDEGVVGAIEVYYDNHDSADDDAQFLRAGYTLVDEIAERLGKVIDRQEAQAKIRALQRQIEFVLGATKTGLCVIDNQFNLQFVDRAWQEIYGDFKGRKCYEYFRGYQRPCPGCGTTRAIKNRCTDVTEETLPREGDRPVQVTSYPFQGPSGQWLVAKVHVDLSRQRELERELSLAQKLESIGQLAAGIAHEINTPTQYVGDNLQFLRDSFNRALPLLERLGTLISAFRDDTISPELLEEMERRLRDADVEYITSEVPRALEESLEGVDRVASIVRAMKEFSHPGGDRRQAIDLRRAIESTLTVSRNEWKYVADLETDFAADVPLVPCYPSELNQALLNILINAGQAIGEVTKNASSGKGKITVSTRRDGDWVEIRVADTGGGIPAAVSGRVFDPFFTTKDVGKGTGQGLAIVYNTIVEKHQGTVHFETEEGRGTCFIVRLPLQVSSDDQTSTENMLTIIGQGELADAAAYG